MAVLLITAGAVHSVAQNAPADDSELKFALVFCRHGVRSPTKANSAYAPFAVQSWPDWPVAPGLLTPHGKQLMALLGSYYRQYFQSQGLLSANDQQDVNKIFFYADNSQRTLDSADGLASGMLPSTGAVIHSFTAGQSDPLFYPVKANLGNPDTTLAASALSGRIGNNPSALTDANKLQFDLMESILLNQPADADGSVAPDGITSVESIPLKVSPGSGGSIVGFDGSVDQASTLAEIFLLEYTEGFPSDQVGWGRLTAEKITQIAQLHTLDFDLTDRTPYLAQAQGSNLLLHIINTLNQAALGIPVSKSIGKPRDKLVMLVGHDNQLASVGSLLNANWQLPSFASNDTPPGGGFVFELRQKPDASYYVRVYFLSQTMDQMRNAVPLTLDAGPAVAPVFIPGASTGNTSYYDCPLASFNKVIEKSIKAKFTN